MPLTQIEFPILMHFLCAVASTTGEQPLPTTMNAPPPPPPSPSARSPPENNPPSTSSPAPPLPKGMVIGPDGKPCRSCTSAATWKAMMSRASSNPSASPSSPSSSSSSPSPSSSATSISTLPSDCPADVETLGRGAWTLLHTIAAQYPERANATRQNETRDFLRLFGKMYPCWVCADDFRAWMSAEGNGPRVGGREDLGRWMCEAHNAVNEKLGKERFDCARWEERWRTGWRDGRCG